MGLSTHILDTALGLPAANVQVVLSRCVDDAWQEIGAGTTDVDGRCRTLLGDHALESGQFRLRFETEPYFRGLGIDSLYPFVEIVFSVRDPAQHHHIPLLIAAHGFTTYRGS